MPKARCPQCTTVVTYQPGYDPVCPSCGFRGAAPVHAAPMQWAAVGSAPQTVQLAQPVPVAYVQAPAYAVARPQNGMATAGLTLGIIGFVLFWIPVLGPLMALLGAVLGGAGLAAAERDPQLAHTRGAALAGLIIGGLALIFGFLVWNDAGWGDPFWWDDW